LHDEASGQGTGLGLATCYGIMKQTGGSISVRSEPGRGTTFDVYFPRSATAATAVAKPAMRMTRSGSETVLFVEDDPVVRRLASRVLRASGYVVHETGESRRRHRDLRWARRPHQTCSSSTS